MHLLYVLTNSPLQVFKSKQTYFVLGENVGYLQLFLPYIAKAAEEIAMFLL